MQNAIDAAISSSSDTPSEALASVESLDSHNKGIDYDSGFSEASPSASGSPTRRSSSPPPLNSQPSSQRRATNIVRPLENRVVRLFSRFGSRQRETRTGNGDIPGSSNRDLHAGVLGDYGTPAPLEFDDNESIRTLKAPRGSVAPSDYDDNESIKTLVASQKGPKADKSPLKSTPDELLSELETLSEASADLGHVPDEALVNRLRQDLQRLTEIMAAFHRFESEQNHLPNSARTKIPPEVREKIESLFDRIRKNLSLSEDEDERILHGKDIHRRNVKGETALHIASRRRPPEVEAIKKFLRLGASPSEPDNEGYTPLLAVVSPRPDPEVREAFNLLLNAGPNLNAQAMDGWTPLTRAATTFHSDFAEALVDKGADVNKAGPKSKTALHFAAEFGIAEVVQKLISSSAKVNATDSGGLTALDVRLEYGWFSESYHFNTVELLINAGASLSRGSSRGETPLHQLLRLVKDEEKKISNYRSPIDIIHISNHRWSLNNFLSLIYLIVGRLTRVTLNETTRDMVRTTYSFGELEPLDKDPVESLLPRLQRRIGEVMILSSKELHRQISEFYRGK